MTARSSPTADGSPSKLSVAAAFAAIYLFWGCTFLALRYAVDEVPPLLTIAYRCLGGALVLYAWLAWRRELEPPTRQQWLTSAIAGAFLFVGGHGTLAWAEQRVSSGQAALFMTCIPLWLVLLTSVRERRRPAASVVVGLLLGVAGVSMLARGNGHWSGTLLDRLGLIGAGLSWAIGSIVARDGARPQSAIQSTAMQLGAGGVAVIAVSILSGELVGWSPDQVSIRGVLSLLFMLIGGTVFGFAAYTWLLRVTTPAAVGTYAFVNPVVAVAIAWTVGDEPFAIRTVVAAIIILAGVVLIWRSSRREAERRRGGEAEGPRVSGLLGQQTERVEPERV